jgi:hypothetical protein
MLSAGGNLSQMISMKVRGRVNSVFEGLVELQAGATWQSSRIFTELGGAMDEKLEVVIFFLFELLRVLLSFVHTSSLYS